MRYYDNGRYYTVSVSKREVEAFKRRWPCSELPDKSIAFQFDKRNGDLVDISLDVDGPDVLALSEDAQAYGESAVSASSPISDAVTAV